MIRPSSTPTSSSLRTVSAARCGIGGPGTSVQRCRRGRNPYLWLGTSKVFRGFVFAFERTPAGWIWIHAYPSAGDSSTCIVECQPETWRGLGLDRLGPADGLAQLERIFAGPLEGHRLLQRSRDGGPAPWLTFRQVASQTWCDGTVVLAGDAAHTTHFTIGSGTKLAVQDAIALAGVLPADAEDPPAALSAYDERRRAALYSVQRAAQRSMQWFEDIDAHLGDDPTAARFALELWQRRGHYPLWRQRLHLATQDPCVRLVRRQVSAVRRLLRARRRGELDAGAIRAAAAAIRGVPARSAGPAPGASGSEWRPVVVHVGEAGPVPCGMAQVVNEYLSWPFSSLDVQAMVSTRGHRGDRLSPVLTAACAVRMLGHPQGTGRPPPRARRPDAHSEPDAPGAGPADRAGTPRMAAAVARIAPASSSPRRRARSSRRTALTWRRTRRTHGSWVARWSRCRHSG